MVTEDGHLLPDLESLIDFDAFGNTAIEKGLRSVAIRLTNLLFQEKGTCYDDYDMGVGIKTYLYDRELDMSVSELKDDIAYQVQHYMKDIEIDRVETEFLPASKLHNGAAGGTLVVRVRVREPIEGERYLTLKLSRNEDSSSGITVYAG